MLIFNSSCVAKADFAINPSDLIFPEETPFPEKSLRSKASSLRLLSSSIDSI